MRCGIDSLRMPTAAARSLTSVVTTTRCGRSCWLLLADRAGPARRRSLEPAEYGCSVVRFIFCVFLRSVVSRAEGKKRQYPFQQDSAGSPDACAPAAAADDDAAWSQLLAIAGGQSFAGEAQESRAHRV